MSDKGETGSAQSVLNGLKPFQVRTAMHAFRRLYEAKDGSRRFLVADEAGLGKTLVAAGVIAQAIEHLREKRVPRIDIIYICSNQAIARQNVGRLRQNLDIDAKPLAERVTLLPHRLTNLNQPVNLIALTPGTSFNSASAEGVAEERIILFRVLSEIWGDLGPNSRLVFRGGLKDVERFKQYERWTRVRDIDKGIMGRFRDRVGGPGSQLHCEFKEVRDRLAESDDRETRRLRAGLVGRLRGMLARACLSSLEPDLVILDEFQRFRDLLDENTESGELAKHLFEYEDEHTEVRTLLLSATPYKMYTRAHETQDDHYSDFLRTVSFLTGKDGTAEPLQNLLEEFRLAMSRATGDGLIDENDVGQLEELRAEIQAWLRSVMSRTERRGGDVMGDPMLDVRQLNVDVKPREVKAFLQAREVAEAVDAPGVMEYWKSAPYLLSFMERYKLSQRLQEAGRNASDGFLARLIKKNSLLQISKRSLSQRSRIDGGNGRMRAFMRDISDSNIHKLLWLPPSLPSYELGRDFRNARNATKRLVFSSWAMVPRAVAIMASYDAERRYIKEDAQESRYGLELRANNYSVFSLLAPSHTLAEYGDPLRYAAGNIRLLLREIENRLRPLVEEITRNAPTHGRANRLWYAVAPLLLDEQTLDSLGWLQGPEASHSTGDAERAGSTTWPTLLARIREGLGAGEAAALGRPPDDLARVLALLAAGSPANVSLRSLSRITAAPLTDNDLKSQSMRAAWGFRSLFRAPIAVGVLMRMYRPGIPGCTGQYWRRLLAYAIEGGLSDVLDEYLHLTREAGAASSGVDGLVDSLGSCLSLTTGVLEISQWKANGTFVERGHERMHQHFARRYVSDKSMSAEQQASQHLDLVRDAFNSPFWPFVLGTTSIGQEGLDFHRYCHAVVHWNLPSNPVDLEQREGRVHRYHGHAVRKNIAQMVGAEALEEARAVTQSGDLINPWEAAYRLADEEFGDDSGLMPHWIFTQGRARIQRYSPVPPLSRDAKRLAELRRSLTVYRMVFGQPRQEDFLEFILGQVPEERRRDVASALTVDLSPPS